MFIVLKVFFPQYFLDVTKDNNVKDPTLPHSFDY